MIGECLLRSWSQVSPHPTSAHVLQEQIVFDRPCETASYYGPLNRVSGNHGLHVEHHDFPNIAGPNMARLHALASRHYQGLFAHRSRLRCLWRFIADPGIGLDSRITTEAAGPRPAVSAS
jgi:sphingolipid 4-desaturase/C4-monooxygenase